MPLTPAAVQAATRPASPDRLNAVAGRLRHPILAPITIDFNRGLTPDSAAVLAVIANPALRAVRDRHSLASSQLLQAGLLPNPTLDFTFDPVTGGNTVGTVTAYSIGPSWEVTALITHEAKVAAARAGSESAQLDVAWQEWQFAQAAKKAVYDVLALRAQAAEADATDKRLAGNLELIRRAVDSHERTLLDLSAAEAAGQKAHADALVTRHDLRQQELTLKQSLGLPLNVDVLLQDSGPLPDRLQLPTMEELVTGLEDRRLDLLALRQGYQSQEQTLRVAVLAQFPKIVLGFHQASDTTNVHTTGFGVTIDLPIFDRNQGTIAIETATRQKLFDEYASRVFESRAAIAQSLADIGSLTEQIEAAGQAIPSLENLVKTYETAVGQHNVDVLSFYNAQNDLAQKRGDLLKLKQQLLDNKIALELAAGRYLPGTWEDSLMKSWTVGIIVVIAVVVAGGGGYWLGHRGAAEKPKEDEASSATTKPDDKPIATITVAPIRRGTLSQEITAYGTVIAPANEIQVVSVPFECRVTKMLVTPGETVNADQPLIEVQASAATVLAVEEAQNAATAAERDLQLVKQRYDQKLATNTELYTAENTLRTARGRLRSLQQGGAAGRGNSRPISPASSARWMCNWARSFPLAGRWLKSPRTTKSR